MPISTDLRISLTKAFSSAGNAIHALVVPPNASLKPKQVSAIAEAESDLVTTKRRLTAYTDDRLDPAKIQAGIDALDEVTTTAKNRPADAPAILAACSNAEYVLWTAIPGVG